LWLSSWSGWRLPKLATSPTGGAFSPSFRWSTLSFPATLRGQTEFISFTRRPRRKPGPLFVSPFDLHCGAARFLILSCRTNFGRRTTWPIAHRVVRTLEAPVSVPSAEPLKAPPHLHPLRRVPEPLPRLLPSLSLHPTPKVSRKMWRDFSATLSAG